MALPRSDDELLLLHNPRCSKSRETLALLEERGANFVIREYLKEPLSREELEDLKGRLGLPVADWLRSGESVFAESDLSKDASEADLLATIERDPILLQRPILVRGARARIGRPPADVLTLL